MSNNAELPNFREFTMDLLDEIDALVDDLIRQDSSTRWARVHRMKSVLRYMDAEERANEGD